MPKKILLGVLSLFATLLLSSCETINSVSNPLPQGVATLGTQGFYVSPTTFGFVGQYVINVDLQPTKHAVANENYAVDLYENGKIRDSRTVSFNQPEINVQADKIVRDYPLVSCMRLLHLPTYIHYTLTYLGRRTAWKNISHCGYIYCLRQSAFLPLLPSVLEFQR